MFCAEIVFIAETLQYFFEGYYIQNIHDRVMNYRFSVFQGMPVQAGQVFCRGRDQEPIPGKKVRTHERGPFARTASPKFSQSVVQNTLKMYVTIPGRHSVACHTIDNYTSRINYQTQISTIFCSSTNPDGAMCSWKGKFIAFPFSVRLNLSLVSQQWQLMKSFLIFSSSPIESKDRLRLCFPPNLIFNDLPKTRL